MPTLCESMLEYCLSNMHFNFLRETCPYTCQQCQNDCKDRVACAAIKRIGGCDRYDGGIIQRWCPRSCGLCKDKNQIPNKKQKEANDKRKAEAAKKKAAEDAKKKADAEAKRKAAEKTKKKAMEDKKNEASDLVNVDMPNFDKLIKQKNAWNIEETTCIDGIKFKITPRKMKCNQPNGCLEAVVVASDDKRAKWATAAEVNFYVINSDPEKTIQIDREATLNQDATTVEGDILAPLDDLVDGNRGFIRDNTVTVLVKIVLPEAKSN